MDNENKTTGVEFTLANGEVVGLNLNFKKLKLLRKLDIDLYNRFSKVMFGKTEDVIDLVLLIYVAYWCENFNAKDKIYTEDEFSDLVVFNMTEIQRTFAALTQAKKK